MAQKVEEEAKTLKEWIKEQDDEDAEIEAAINDPLNHMCSYSYGYVRQDVYVCLTCTKEKGVPVCPSILPLTWSYIVAIVWNLRRVLYCMP